MKRASLSSPAPPATRIGSAASPRSSSPRPRSTGDQLTFSDFLNLFVFNTKYNVGGLLKALQTRGFLQSLAEPNLIAYNGREASFLAGGEIPIPVVQGNANAVSILYKEFGIRLNFTPTIAGDVIRLHVRPEVSTLDFANGVTHRRVPYSGATSRDGPKPRSSCATANRSRLPV